MSSTGRGAVRKENDFYSTPEAAFKPLLPHLKGGIDIWEPASGDGRLVRWLKESGHEAAGDDLANGYDFLKDNRMRGCILTNPPFSLALQFCEHARRHAPEVIMLLRLNFLGAQTRYDWWCRNEPSALYVLSDRPDFTGGGGDSCEYAWFCWGIRYSGIHHLMADKAVVERKAILEVEF